MRKITLVAALLGFFAVSFPASANPLFYSFTPRGAQPSFTFNVDSKPIPDSTTFFGFTEAVQNFSQNGVPVADNTSVTFYNDAARGGLGVLGFQYYGQSLYTSSFSDYTLLTGSYTLYSDSRGMFTAGTLSVTNAVAAVPEPATWGMMLLGFGGVGFTMRRRKSKATSRLGSTSGNRASLV